MDFTIRYIFKSQSFKMNEGERGLILIYNCRAHLNDDISPKINDAWVDLILFPDNTRGTLLLNNLSFNKFFKANYELYWLYWEKHCD